MEIVFTILLVILACFLVHEGGHFLAALCFEYRLKFYFEFGRFKIPRFVWYMPIEIKELWHRKIIAIAGFGSEFLAVPIFHMLCPDFAVWYAFFAAGHFIAYPFYAGEENDFYWLY